MALNKTKTLDSGVTGSYWKIKLITFDAARSITNVVLSLYKDKQCRLGKKSPLDFVSSYNKSEEEPSNRADLYTYLKTLPDFNGAKDI